jgi:hypothetical protein
MYFLFCYCYEDSSATLSPKRHDTVKSLVADGNFRSVSAVRHPICSPAGLERKAVTQQEFSATKILTAAFAVKQLFNWLQTRCY